MVYVQLIPTIPDLIESCEIIWDIECKGGQTDVHRVLI